MRYSLSLVTILALAAAAACSSDSVTDSRTLVGLELAMTPPRDTLFLGGADSLTTSSVVAHATINGRHAQLPGHVFESGDTAVATIASFKPSDSTAVVTAVGPGTTTVAVRVNGERATTTIVVLPFLKSVTLTAPVTQVLVRDTIPLTAKAFGWDGDSLTGQTFTFTSSSPSATVSAKGVVTFTAAGSATITVRSGDQIATVALTALAREFIGGTNSIASGMDATCGLMPLGRAFCFGRAPVTGIARDTACFDVPGTPGDPIGCSLIPLPIASNVQLTALAVGDSVACGLSAAGQAYCWGDQKYGEVGNGQKKAGESALPVRVTGPLNDAGLFRQITAGHAHACGLISTGAAYCWGLDDQYQSGGNNDTINVSSSTPTPAGGNHVYSAITAGFAHTCGLTSAGVAYCWGANSHGQLGRGFVSAPSDSTVAVSGLTFTQISASGDNTCGLTGAGLVYCWGANSFSQTGQAASDSIPSPALVAGTGYTFLAVGGQHVCASKGTTVSCWGSNRYGQLGRSMSPVALPFSATPTPVSGSQAFSSLSSGTRTSCAVASDGAYCWGSSIYGATGSQVQAIAVIAPQKTGAAQ